MEYDILIVGGLGHVGLPLGIVLADCGYTVALYDIDMSKRARVESGEMPFIEYGADPILKKVIGKKLFVSSDISDVARAQTIIITIGTPVDEYLSPKTKSLFSLADTLFPHIRPDHCLLLRSTVYPGTSQYLHEYFRSHGHPVHLAFCPERIVQGYAIQELRKLPQIVSGFSAEALNRARILFERLGVEVIELDVEGAELSKLYLNAWRYIQFAVGNQFYMIAAERGIDYANVYKAMTHHYDRARDLPRPGFAAGPCLFKDTMQLAAANRNQFLLGHAAMMVNEGLPDFLVAQLKNSGVQIGGTTIGILGMAFKADIDDTRDALSYKLAKILRFHGARVLCSDEFVRDASFVSQGDLFAQSSIVIVGVPHTSYRTLAVPPGVRTLDLWGILPAAAQ